MDAKGARETLRNKDHEQATVGLAENAPGVPFQCATCKWFREGTCYNPIPALFGVLVRPEWCCNLYDHKGMKVRIK